MTIMHAGSVAKSAIGLVGAFFGQVVRRDRGASDAGVCIVDRAETRRQLDALARRELNMTGAQFTVALRAGTLPRSPAVDHLALLADVADAS